MQKEETIFKMIKTHHKKTFEKSKKEGKIDLDFIPLCEHINKTKNYFTSSCCSGRIALVGLNKEESKKESAFHRKWHKKVSLNELITGIKTFNGEVLWLKQEPIILHLGTNNIENAKKILKLCEKTGLKRSGLKVIKEGKYLIEIIGNHQINLPVKENLISIEKNYLEYVLKKCNQKFEKNQKTLKQFTKEIKKHIK